MRKTSKLVAYLALALTVFVVSPIDDIIFAAVFGSVLFGFGTIGFYCLSIITTFFSVFMWRVGKKKSQLKEVKTLEKSDAPL